ncbi:response regulator transcription factor [Egicoccus sp. AB-alg2]|uniref:helix-turn-helix transcriptional regulator n=1 Tax=Egicoccus sp. AB-alg2 TaxID=3242693 RepID=UPI00359D173A
MRSRPRCELSGELERFTQWNDIVSSVAERYGHPGLLSFCATCSAEALTAAGDWAAAEEQLRMLLGQLRASGHRARCVPPAAKLAELLVDQGRFEEAAAAVDEADEPATLVVRAKLSLAQDDPIGASTLLERACRRLGGDSLLTAPALALLVTAHLQRDDVEMASGVVERLDALARRTGHRRVAGRAALARAQVAAASADTAAARQHLEAALDDLEVVAPGAIETADAHLALGRLLVVDAPDLAAAEARAALAGYERVGATHAVDGTAALLRSLGDRSRVGPKNVGVLTQREQEVLRLVAQGLTNAEIAERLFISVKTAGNHVSNILAKLGLRSRVEAAAYAALHAGDR